MKKLLLVFLLALPTVLCAQKVYYYGQLQANRMEDGRTQYIDTQTNKPLKGECKVIESYRENNNYFVTKYKNGFKDGKDVGYRRGRLNTECYFKEGKRDGRLTEYYSAGEIKREADFKNGVLDGKEMFYFVNGQVEKEINYKNGRQHGREIAYSWREGENELVRELNFTDGKPDGKQMKQVSGNRGDYTVISEYKNGELLDEKEYHYPSGNIRKIKENGKETNYRDDGTVESELYYNENGKLEGEQKRYYPDGQIERISTYKNGQKEGPVKEYYADGQLKLDETYKEDVRTGVSTEYYPNGQKKSFYTFKEYYRTGPFKIYYDDGKLKEEGEAENDNYVYRKTYYKNGQLKSYWTDNNGTWTEIESYDEDGKQL